MNRSLACQPDRQRAVALIVTLIMLAVITTLAVAFLALTRRETAAVDAMSRTTDAELAADSGLERAKAEMLAAFITRNARTNGADRMGPDFMVSVARDTYGIDPTKNNTVTNLNNLLFDPSVPVFANTNRPATPAPTRPQELDDRSYLDLDRSGTFQPTGFLEMLDDNGNAIPGLTNWVVGDPQWIGLLQRPQLAHSGTNRYIARYAYAVLPVGRGLDINYIHNNANPRQDSAAIAYFRNQGFGSYEINLAAFLSDLNTNVWHRPSAADPDRYQFNPNPAPNLSGSVGLAFFDARELLNYRYDQDPRINRTPNTLSSINQLFPSITDNHFGSGSPLPDWIDGYANGPVQPLGESIALIANPNPEINDNPDNPWPGSDSPRRYYTLHDFFDPLKLPVAPNGFRKRLQDATQGNLLANQGGKNTYNQYTFYRMLSQLGTDSDDESRSKININYDNVNRGPNGEAPSVGNFMSWKPIDLFTNIADRLLRDDFGIGVHRIPVFTNNSVTWTNRGIYQGPLYSSRIHQILQLAANICDATYSNKYSATETFPFYPSVFRPQFQRDGNDIFISGYVEDPGVSVTQATPKWLALEDSADRSQITTDSKVYGIPLIIGARKGFPNFNEFVVQSAVELSRKLEVERPNVSARPTQTNQMFIMGISNAFGVEAWYPYTNAPYPRALRMTFANVLSATLTNEVGLAINFTFPTGHSMIIPANTWQTNRFIVPPISVVTMLPDSVYRQLTRTFEPISRQDQFEAGLGAYTNRWALSVTNRMLFFLEDDGHLVDAVSLAASSYFDITEELNKKPPPESQGSIADNAWSSRVDPRNGIEGIYNQMAISMGVAPISPSEWRDYGSPNPQTGGGDKELAIDALRLFVNDPRYPPRRPTNAIPPVGTSIQVAFTATRKMYQTVNYSANDPFVHYRVDDLRDSSTNFYVQTMRPITRLAPLTGQTWLSNVNARYSPWGGRSGSSTSTPDYDSASKDPSVFNPSSWDFPNQKFPNVGWLGRVHRGTPWQTVYFKSAPVPPRVWSQRTGAAFSTQTYPTNDWRLADLFTVALHPNQTRGRLSINQTNRAAWSAVLSGIQVTRIADEGSGDGMYRTNEVFQPAAVDFPTMGFDSPLLAILDGPKGINAVRALTNRTFSRLADVLAVPALTDDSPFLKPPFTGSAAANQRQSFRFPATDADYERIPQQILSLLRAGESRFVVYAWGQSLKPANPLPVPGFAPSIVTSGDDKGLVKNYQVTGEMATRAVVRVEFDDELGTNRTTGDVFRTGRKAYHKPHAVVESFNIIPVD